MAEYQIIGTTYEVYTAWGNPTIMTVDAEDEVDAAQQVLFRGYVMGATRMTEDQMAHLQWSQSRLPVWYPFKPEQLRQIVDHFEPPRQRRT